MNKTTGTDLTGFGNLSGLNKTAAPKLRFPEFQDSPDWEEKEVGEVFKVTRGEVLSMTLVQDIRTKETPYPVYSSQTKNNGLSGFYSKYLYEDAITWTTDGANAGDVNYRTGKFFCTNVCGVLINTDGYANRCVASLINNVSRKYVSYVGNPKLMNGVMSKIKIPFPSVAEQQKIADCLTSLDDLIAVQSQKVEALKAYKKGLMQNLFPAEGESVPRLRFPEFESAGEWEKKTLGEICNFTRGPFGGSLKKDIFVKSGYAVYEQSHAIYQNFDSFRYYISKEKFIEMKRFAVHPDDIIMSCSGTMGKFAIVPKDAKSGVINQALLKLTVKKGLDVGFIKVVLELPNNQENLLSQSAGGAIKNVVSVGQIKELNLYIPSLQEQQRIAEFLTSIDEQITAQSEAVAALKVHKKGLMQGLFPSVQT
jgi:type I restriction enzyme S subunit